MQTTGTNGARECASPFCTVEFEPVVHNQVYHEQQCKRDVENITRRRLASKDSETLTLEANLLKAIEEPLEAGVNTESQVEYLRGVARRLARENARLKLQKHEMANAIQQNVQQNLAQLSIPKVTKPPADRRKRTEEQACAVLSDFQIGKKTKDYDVATAEERLELYADKLLRITEMQRTDHPVRTINVWLLGDMVEGEQIFPGQGFLLDASLYRQVSVDGPRMIVNFIRRMLANFERVHVVGVVGNHGAIGGRGRHEMHPESNADRMLYTNVFNILANEDRITWNIPESQYEGEFFTIESIGKKKFLLLHGHQWKGSSGVPVAAIDKKIKGWAMGALKDNFDYALLGHFHEPTRITVNTATVWVNGTIESSNGYAVEVLAAVGRPCQYLLFTHPEHGVTSEWCLYLDNDW